MYKGALLIQAKMHCKLTSVVQMRIALFNSTMKIK